MFPAGYFAQAYFPTSYFFAGATTISGEMVWQLPAPTVSIAGAHGVAGAIVLDLPAPMMTASAGTIAGIMSVTLPAPTMNATAVVASSGSPWESAVMGDTAEISTGASEEWSVFGTSYKTVWHD